MEIKRREFLKQCASLGFGSFLIPGIVNFPVDLKATPASFFDISLAEWSLHKALFDEEITHLQFPDIAKNEFGIDAVEYVNQFFKDRATDKNYLNELNTRCDDLGVKQLLIMVDGEGNLADSNPSTRTKAVENHYKWIEAAGYLGCNAIRVNLFGDGNRQQQKDVSVKSLGQLAEFARDYETNVTVENHGGFTSDASWLIDVIRQVDMENCGTLPDFGNFCIEREGGDRWQGTCIDEYDRYQGVKQMMPYATNVSAKSYDFNKQGKEATIDYHQMLNIIHQSGYNGYIGIEYEGNKLSEFEGITATKKLLEQTGFEITKQ